MDLDKGLLIDANVGVSLLGIQLPTVDARIVVANVDTYLRFAEATSRLDLAEHGGRPPAGRALPAGLREHRREPGPQPRQRTRPRT